MRDINLLSIPPRIKLCSAPSPVTDIPLRVKQSMAQAFLNDSEFKQVDNVDLFALCRERKNLHVTDRASAIAVLKGVPRSWRKVTLFS